MSDEVVVKLKHLRPAGFCVEGAIAFTKRYGIDWNLFKRQGLPASRLEATGNALARKLVEVARGKP